MNKATVRVERVYDASIELIWSLWTTKEGFESWWGPEGFRVAVQTIDPVVGGKLSYSMIAVGADEIAYMKKEGWAVAHKTNGIFTEVTPMERLKINHQIDFIPGVAPYENNMVVEFIPGADGVRMVVNIDEHPDRFWTEQATQGFESQLKKVPAALERLAAK